MLRWKPYIKWDKDCDKELEQPKVEYPWFCNWNENTVDIMGKGKKPDGKRLNDGYYGHATKQAARGPGGRSNR